MINPTPELRKSYGQINGTKNKFLFIFFRSICLDQAQLFILHVTFDERDSQLKDS